MTCSRQTIAQAVIVGSPRAFAVIPSEAKRSEAASSTTTVRTRPLCAVLLVLLFLCTPAHAHLNSKDVFEQVHAGPYILFVTMRPPLVIPGVATIEVRTSSQPVTSVSITAVPLTGEAANHPPAADPMHRSATDPAFFTGSLWLMAQGSWQVRFEIDGEAGSQKASVPVAAMPLTILPLQRSLSLVLAVLGLILVIGMAGIVAAAVREARLSPGTDPSPTRRRRSLVAAAGALAVMALFLYGGATWWNVEAAGYSLAVYRPLVLHPDLAGNTLDLTLSSHEDRANPRRARSNDDLLPDHGHLMHLYAIRMPAMDAAFHLHPERVAPGHLRLTLPSMPAGTYNLYGDIVHANGFPETLTATLAIPAGLPPSPLQPEDASAAPPPLSSGTLGPACKLPDGYTMTWDRPASLTTNTPYIFRFHLLDPAGHPAADIHPYLGMAGHAAFVRADGTTFAHTHPEGSASMQAMELANPGAMGSMKMPSPDEPLPNTVGFPYGLPAPGRYRIFVQMKHGHTVETGVFDADVQPQP